MAPLCQETVYFPCDDFRGHKPAPEKYLAWFSSFGAFDKLFKARSGSVDVRDIVPSANLWRNARPTSGIETLPPELMALIPNNPSLDAKDIMGVGLASQSLWLHVAMHIRREHSRCFGS